MKWTILLLLSAFYAMPVFGKVAARCPSQVSASMTTLSQLLNQLEASSWQQKKFLLDLARSQRINQLPKIEVKQNGQVVIEDNSTSSLRLKDYDIQSRGLTINGHHFELNEKKEFEGQYNQLVHILKTIMTYENDSWINIFIPKAEAGVMEERAATLIFLFLLKSDC